MITPPNINAIDRRTIDVLRALVSVYLRRGGPVSSQIVVKYGRLKVSSATVRMVMGRLTDLGLLTQPHSSAGRIPTAAGLRIYIDHLMSPRAVPFDEARQLTALLKSGNPTAIELMQKASNSLASICHSAAIGRTPCLDDAVVDAIDFMPLSETRILAVLTLDNHDIHHRVVDVGTVIVASDLYRAQEQFKERWAGCQLAEIRRELRTAVERGAKVEAANVSVMEVVRSALAALTGRSRIVVAGRSHVLSADVEVGHASSLLQALDNQELLLELLDGIALKDDTQVVIGHETKISAFEPFTVVTAPYRDQHNRMGRLAIVGPLRMDYSKAVSWVSYAARAISGMLEQGVRAG